MRVAECGSGGSAVKGPVDFTGYWALAKHEGMDEFLRAAGFPWVVRKAALKFGGSAVDLVAHTGPLLRVTSLNAKGSWARCYDVEREVVQASADGARCRTTCWWEGRVLRARLEGSPLGALESWRYLRGGAMAVRTALRPAGGGPEVSMFWFFDRMGTLSRHAARGGSLLQQIEQDQRRVARATRRDSADIQDVLLDWTRWRSPADEFIAVAAPPASLARHSRRRRSPGSGSPRTMSPMSLSKSPSNDSLAALPPGVEVRSEARSIRSDSRGSRGRPADSELSNSALDRMARQAAAIAASECSAADGAPSPPPGAAPPSGRPPAAPAAAQAAAQPGGGGERSYGREPTLSYPGGAEVPVEPRAGAPPRGDSLTLRTPAPASPGRGEVEGDSDVATRGSVHHRTGSVGSVGVQRSMHYKSMSADSTGRGGAASTPGRGSPRSTTPAALPPPAPAEQLMALRLHEFGDSRGIASVVPVATPNDTAEPQLLCMSPEQAEETAAKLRELEADLLLRRQGNRRGLNLCGCLVVTLASDTLPEHLRVWEYTQLGG